MARSATFALCLPALDPPLPVDFFFAVDFPGDLACKRKPHVVVMAIVGEPTSPRRWQERRCSRTRSIWSKGVSDPPLAVEAQHNFDRCLSGARAYGQLTGAVFTPTQPGIE